MKSLFASIVMIASILVLFSCKNDNTKAENTMVDESSKLGLVEADLFNDELDLLKEMPAYSTSAPGTSQRYERAFENAPPMIPHSTEGLVPITKDKHMCITCHMPELAAAVKSTPIPATHFTDYRPDVNVNSDGTIQPDKVVQKDLKGKLDMSRYMCTQCHVPQANIEPAVQNNFNAAYRRREARNQSNLSESISEGVK